MHVPGPGCYGHNGADDAAFDAALIARAFPLKPVLLKWSRADEHAWEPYATATVVDVSATLDASNWVAEWHHYAYGDTHRARPRPEPGGKGASRLLAARLLASPFPDYVPTPNMARHAGIHRNADPLYAFPERRIVKNLVRGLPLRVSAMRTLGGFANVFAIESFMDELAHAAQLDPLAFRLAHLHDKRARAVLQRAADELNWPVSRQPSLGSGLAVARYKNAQAWCAVGVQLQVG